MGGQLAHSAPLVADNQQVNLKDSYYCCYKNWTRSISDQIKPKHRDQEFWKEGFCLNGGL